MNGGIHNFQICLLLYYFGINAQTLYHLQVGFIHFFTNQLNQMLPSRKFHFRNALNRFHFFYHINIVRGNELSSIVPIGFIPIVFFRIVGGGTHYAPFTMQLTNGKTQFRRRSQRFEQVNLYAIGSKNMGGCFGKKTTVIATIMGNCYGNRSIAVGFFKIIRKTLGSHTDGIFINPVTTYSHDSPQPSGSKFQIPVKAIG